MAWFFDAPAKLRDFSDPGVWHADMEQTTRGIVQDLVATVLGKPFETVTDADIVQHAPELAYVNPVATPPTTEGETVAVAPWPAFPRAVQRKGPWLEFPHHDEDRLGNYRAVENVGQEDIGQLFDKKGNELKLPVRHRQDEYLEWAARRDQNGKLVKVIFVAEGYDYFSTLFDHDEKKVVEIYQDFTGDKAIRADDLRATDGIYVLRNNKLRPIAAPGSFNPRNRFNINPGIVHLSHKANSLGAEVTLAGVSGILRLKADGTQLIGNNPEELLCCCAGGEPNRHSDPLICAQAYAQVRAGYRYTLANPVGLYIAGIEHDRVRTKDGEPLDDRWWTVVRGDGLNQQGNSRVLRLEIAAPAGSGLTLEDLEVNGSPVRFAGQLAELLLVHLFVTRWKRADASTGPQVNCIATCCREKGGSQLFISAGDCEPKAELAFPGLVAALAALDASLLKSTDGEAMAMAMARGQSERPFSLKTR